MPAPFPREGVSKGTVYSQLAKQVYGHYVWLARWSDEIGKDPDVDLKKLGQLALVHCRDFGPLTAVVDADLARAIQQRFGQEGIIWPTIPAMVNDLSAIRAEALALRDYVIASVPEAKILSSRTYDANGFETEVPNTVSKPHPAVAEVAKLRALFE